MKSQKYNSRQVAIAISDFKSMIDNVFSDPLEALENNLGNAGLLEHSEINFIRRASHLNSLSRSLFLMLVNSVGRSKTHTARLHLSGFDRNDNFELLITECESPYWKFTNCRLLEHFPFIFRFFANCPHI